MYLSLLFFLPLVLVKCAFSHWQHAPFNHQHFHAAKTGAGIDAVFSFFFFLQRFTQEVMCDCAYSLVHRHTLTSRRRILKPTTQTKIRTLVITQVVPQSTCM